VAFFIFGVLFFAPTARVHASPDLPMCMADESLAPPSVTKVRWRAPMCGPYPDSFAVADRQSLEERAIEAYRKATELILSASYEEARLQLDLAARGLPRIADRIALQSGRLELLRRHPERAAAFFAEALDSPHDSVRVEASFGHAFALLRADDPEADDAIEELLRRYPSIPNLAQLQYEQAQSLMRRQRYDEAMALLHEIRVEHPGDPVAPAADKQLKDLQRRGYQAPVMSEEDLVVRAQHLVHMGPLDEAKLAISQLLQAPLTGEYHAEIQYLAGRLARYEGRWKDAESYMRSAQSFPLGDVTTAKQIESRAQDIAQTANARDEEQARKRLATLRANRRSIGSIPSTKLVEMIGVAAAASLQTEVDEMLETLGKRSGTPSTVLFDAAMAATGAGSERLTIPLLEEIAKRQGSTYRIAALYHIGRAHERAGRPAVAELFFQQAERAAEAAGDQYYALWARNGLRRLQDGERSSGSEGLIEPGALTPPQPPRAREDALASQLEPIAEAYAGGYPWIARAVDLLRIGEREAATEELFETYLAWRDAQGKPIARAGLDSVARDAQRMQQPLASDVRAARLELTDEDRTQLSAVSAALGDMGTAGGFGGPELIETLPRAYEWLVVPAANRYGLDPNLLLAVMRVESAYQKHIVSYAGAVGLMQIMPRTGQMIAHALGRNDFTPADLLEPRLNLEFAAWYLASLIRRFDGHLPLAIAAYNGGPHNVRKWIQESPQSAPLDVLLERIPFSQTHRYVRKVLLHYEAYRRQRDLQMPQLSMVLPKQRIDPLAF
jgi:soluble lytic murein transglycosylase